MQNRAGNFFPSMGEVKEVEAAFWCETVHRSLPHPSPQPAPISGAGNNA